MTQFFRNAPWLVLLFYCMLLLPFEVRDRRHDRAAAGWLKATFGLSLAGDGERVRDRARRGAVDPDRRSGNRRSRSPSSRRQTLWMIILPQCVKRMLPPWMNLYAILAVGDGARLDRRRQRGDDADRRRACRREPHRAPACRCISTCCSGSSPIATRSPARPSRSSAASRCADDADAVDARPAAGRASPTCTSRSAPSPCSSGVSLDVMKGEVDLHHRPVGLGQVDAAALHQRPRADRARLDPGRGPGGQRRRSSTSSRCAARSAWCSSNTTSSRTRRRCRTS